MLSNLNNSANYNTKNIYQKIVDAANYIEKQSRKGVGNRIYTKLLFKNVIRKFKIKNIMNNEQINGEGTKN